MLTTLDLREGRGKRHDVFTLKVQKAIPKHPNQQQSTMIEVEGMILAFAFSKKYNLSLLPTSGCVFDRCRASTDLQVLMPTSGKNWSGKYWATGTQFEKKQEENIDKGIVAPYWSS
jgi:hypothetical protein